MKLTFLVYSCLCEMNEFKINGIEADTSDFGTKQDEDRESAEDYCCGDMRFTRCEAKSEVLEKYKINIDEYNEIAERLESELSFGRCGWCS